MARIRVHLEQRAAAAPVLVCLDDLHWASPTTLAALRTLPRDLRKHPVAWLLARSSTPQRAAENMFDQLEKDGAARVTLAPLDTDAVAAMLADAFGAPPDQALAELARGAAGNPSLVAELVGGLRDDHAVQVTGGRAVLASARLPERITGWRSGGSTASASRPDSCWSRWRCWALRSGWKMRPRCSARPRPSCCPRSRRPWTPRS